MVKEVKLTATVSGVQAIEIIWEDGTKTYALPESLKKTNPTAQRNKMIAWLEELTKEADIARLNQELFMQLFEFMFNRANPKTDFLKEFTAWRASQAETRN